MLELPEPDRAGWERAVDRRDQHWSGGKDMALKLVLTRGNEFGDGTPTAFAMGLPIADKRAQGSGPRASR